MDDLKLREFVAWNDSLQMGLVFSPGIFLAAFCKPESMDKVRQSGSICENERQIDKLPRERYNFTINTIV